MNPGHVFHRSTSTCPPVATRGEGIFLIDSGGRRYIDACGGAAVSCLGHGHPQIIAAMAAQAASVEYAHTGFFTTAAAEELAATIADQSPGSLDRVWFTGSGSEAIEAALKLARQYHVERGDIGRTKIVTRRQSYHGNTLGALAAGGSVWRRVPYEPLLIDVSMVDPCFEYRFAEPGESSQDYGQRAVQSLEDELLRLKHGQTYNAHPVGCAAALAVQNVIREEDLLGRVKEAGVRLVQLLDARIANHPNIGDIRGRGLLVAMELVADRETKAPFDPALAMHRRAKADAFDRGLLIYPSGGTIDGRNGDHILLAPPYNVTDDEVETIVDLLAQTVDAVLPS